jgi:glucosamine 6-phosphate synthetase-like amidotransferase/phosphosugar isomerase protein
MCGITGFIGKSKDKNLSYQLLTKLFEKSESRGTDAAGFWAAECGFNGSVIYHKEPTRSSSFVKSRFWSGLSDFEVDLVIAHARGASKGVGEPFFNENNHPFTSNDKTIALAHNGRIEDDEYYELRKNYEVSTQCDSEILLRIFESTIKSNKTIVDKELESVKRIFSLIQFGHMAVATGIRQESGRRSLLLFRNEHRPLWVSDLREELGQVFFVSEPSIWEEACNECDSRLLSMCYKLIEVNPKEIWHLSLVDNTLSSNRYRLTLGDESEEVGEEFFTIPGGTPHFNLISKLDENDQIIRKERSFLWSEYDLNSAEEYVARIIEKAKNVELELRYAVNKETMEKELFEETINQLKEIDNSIAKLLSHFF